MGRMTPERHVEPGYRQVAGIQRVDRGRMAQDARVDILEPALFQQNHLAAERFLRRSAQHHDLAGDSVRLHEFAQRQPGGKTGSADQVMSAGVPQLRQRIVFAHHGKHRFAGAELRPVGGIQPTVRRRHPEPGGAQQFHLQPAGLVFFETKLGVLVNRPGDGADLFRIFSDG